MAWTFVKGAEKKEREPKFGVRVGNLTQFHDLWIDLSEVVAFDLDPEDECDSECYLRSGETIHLSDEQGRAVREYLSGIEGANRAIESAR